MDEKQYQELVEKLGKEAADQIKKKAEEIEKNLNAKYEEMKKGLLTSEAFEEYKKTIKETELKTINDELKKLDDVCKEQGILINTLKEGNGKNKKSFEEFVIEQAPTIKELFKSGKYVEFTASQLKAAGITSIGNSVQPMTAPPNSPYAPGIGGADLEIFDIMRNPNFVLNHVDLGRTNQSRLAWINETDYQGAPAEVEEGGDKPMIQHKFKVEISIAKKIAAHMPITEEFEDDLPQLATRVRRMLQNDVIRGWDDAVQVALIQAANIFDNHELDNEIQAANLWDAIMAMEAQILGYNFIPNTVAINPFTNVKMQTAKSSTDEYLLPPFADEINSMLVKANKVAANMGLVGDLTQFKVDVYKEFVLKIGWINDDFTKNQFRIVGEIRYHRYISDARKKAICYSNLSHIAAQIDGTPGSAH